MQADRSSGTAPSAVWIARDVKSSRVRSYCSSWDVPTRTGDTRLIVPEVGGAGDTGVAG